MGDWLKAAAGLAAANVFRGPSLAVNVSTVYENSRHFHM